MAEGSILKDYTKIQLNLTAGPSYLTLKTTELLNL